MTVRKRLQFAQQCVEVRRVGVLEIYPGQNSASRKVRLRFNLLVKWPVHISSCFPASSMDPSDLSSSPFTLRTLRHRARKNNTRGVNRRCIFDELQPLPNSL